MSFQKIFFLSFISFLFSSISWSQQAFADSLERVLKKQTGTERIFTLNELTYFYFQNDVPKSIQFGKEALNLARKQSDKRILANTLNDYSMPYLTDGNFKKALELNLEALAIRKELNDSAGMMSSYAKLGNCYSELGRFKEATTNYKIALGLTKKLKQPLMEMKLLNNLGNLLEISGYWKEAYQMQRDAVRLADQLVDPTSQVTARANMASTARKLKRYQESERLYREAIPFTKLADKEEYLAEIYQGMGVVSRVQGKYREGINYYKNAFEVYKTIGSKIGLGAVSSNLGYAYIDLKNYDSADFYFQISLKNALYTKSYTQIKTAYEGLADLEGMRKNYKKAFEYMQFSNEYADSVQLHQGNSALSEMFAKYETARKDEELAKSKLANAEKDKKIIAGKLNVERVQRQRFIWISVSIFIGLVGVLFIRYFQQKRKAALIEVEKTKNEEQLRREKELNEQKVHISKELHDNIGSQLTYLISSMDNMTYQAKNSEQVSTQVLHLSDFGRGIMQELRSTIWAMNSEEGSLQTLFLKLEELRSKIPIKLTLENQVQTDYPLKALEMLNLYRIAQEAIQNALKYAKTAEFSVVASTKNQQLELVFTDKGIGFNLDKTDLGNGIYNMRNRCVQIGGKFEINSSPGEGTVIRCLFDMAINPTK